MKCEQCKYWVDLKPREGACRRYPPQVINMNGERSEVTHGFPFCRSDWWCGEFSEIDLEEQQKRDLAREDLTKVCKET